jgi:hypothetical protein
LTAHPTALRYAVATFDTWDGLLSALQHLDVDALQTEVFSCLGLQRVFAGDAAIGGLPAIAIEKLPFPESVQPICCTAGRLAQRLLERLHAGAPTLEAALGHWLIARHAAELRDAVEHGRIVLWIQLFDSEDEHRAYRSLLARSSSSVGVHDIAAD